MLPCLHKPFAGWRDWSLWTDIVITNAEQRESVLETCPDLLPERVIGEPVKRDTAAAVGLAALLVEKEGEDASFALLPADHVIEDAVGFQATLETAFEAAEAEDQLVTVGIKPTFPSNGYGYLEQGDGLGNMQVVGGGSQPFCGETKFRKSGRVFERRKLFLECGMFIWRPEVILAEIDRLVPKLSEGLKELKDTWTNSGNLEEAMDQVYPGLEKISTDFAVMEKAERVAMVESSFDWDDVENGQPLRDTIQKMKMEMFLRVRELPWIHPVI